MSLPAELLAETTEHNAYRPYMIRPRPQPDLTVIEKDGTRHGFQCHALCHSKWQRRNGEKFLSFTEGGLAVVMQSRRRV